MHLMIVFEERADGGLNHMLCRLVAWSKFSNLGIALPISFILSILTLSSPPFTSMYILQEEEGTMSVECVGFSGGSFRWAASGGMDKTLKVRNATFSSSNLDL